jgi:addiction module HigA family antidote
MTKVSLNQYKPDFVSPPGETLEETIEAINMTQVELAKRMGRPLKTINEIIQGKAAITADTALQLERVIGIPASFWNNREYHYRESMARIAEEKRLANQIEWLERFPIAAMIRLGWIPKQGDPVQQLQELLNFFRVASPDQWAELWQSPVVAYRRSAVFESHPEAVSAWLRKGELEAQHLPCAPYSAKKFADHLGLIRGLTTTTPQYFLMELKRMCAAVGVAVVYLPSLPKAPISGATRWLTPDKALLQLSFRHKSDDIFWFSFFHEAGHILRHGKRAIFIEDNAGTSSEEQEADTFAREMLIPEKRYIEFVKSAPYSHARINSFAEQIGIAPGIVVGRLQKDGILPHSYCNDCKKAVDDSMIPASTAV